MIRLISMNAVRIPGDEYQHFRGWWSVPGVAFTFAVAIIPYVFIAFLERQRHSLTNTNRASLARLNLAETLGWIAVFFINHGALVNFHFRLPGELGEEIGWRGFLVRRWMDRPLIAAMISMPVWALFHLPVILLPHRPSDLTQNISLLAANGLMGAVALQLYLWARSIWPSVALHVWWNLSNETFLGDVYGWQPGLFDGQLGVFNAEGLFGCIVLLPIATLILLRLKDNRKA
jgi:membrane protease YdiL (CAAX protease family)